MAQQQKATLGAQYVLGELGGSKSLGLSTITFSGYLKEVQDKRTLERCT